VHVLLEPQLQCIDEDFALFCLHVACSCFFALVSFGLVDMPLAKFCRRDEGPLLAP
jgi:hypothetical protein